MNTHERGLTLIEVLASLAILSFISVIIWSVFFQGYKYSQNAISKNSILQEVNILTSNITKLHQSLETYEISSENCSIKITDLKMSPHTEQLFSNTKICFKILEINNVSGAGPTTVEPNKSGNDVSLKISASDKNNSQNDITVKTYLYRIKGADYQ